MHRNKQYLALPAIYGGRQWPHPVGTGAAQ